MARREFSVDLILPWGRSSHADHPRGGCPSQAVTTFHAPHDAWNFKIVRLGRHRTIDTQRLWSQGCGSVYLSLDRHVHAGTTQTHPSMHRHTPTCTQHTHTHTHAQYTHIRTNTQHTQNTHPNTHTHHTHTINTHPRTYTHTHTYTTHIHTRTRTQAHTQPCVSRWSGCYFSCLPTLPEFLTQATPVPPVGRGQPKPMNTHRNGGLAPRQGPRGT